MVSQLISLMDVSGRGTDFEPTPVWENVLLGTIILLCIWWSNSQRIAEMNSPDSRLQMSRKARAWYVIKSFALDFGDDPLTFLKYLALLVTYALILLYSWFVYVVFGVVAIIWLCAHYEEWRPRR